MRGIGVDLLDVFREQRELTPRVVLWLVGQLPDGTAFVAKQRGGPEFRPWTSTVHLLAALVNLTYSANRQRGGKATRKGIVEPPKVNATARKMTVTDLIAMQKKRDRG